MKPLYGLLLLFTLPLTAADYYVDGNNPSAADTNPGTEAAPWATISHANGLLSPGDVLYVKDGMYRETVKPLVSGESGNVITYRAYPGHAPVVNGAELITGWEQHAGNIYKAYVDWTPSSVFEDGDRLAVSVDPNNGYHRAESATYTTLTDADLPDGDWVGSKVYFETDRPFTRNVIGWDAGSHTITWDDSVDSYHYGIIKSGFDYYFMDGLSLLDEAGEIYFNDSFGTLYVWATDGADPEEHEMEIPQRSFGFDLRSASYIRVEGFEVKYINRLASSSWLAGPIYSWRGGHAGYEVVDNTVHDCENTAIYFRSGSGDLVEGNHVYNIKGDGIRFLQQRGGIIRDNHVHDIHTDGIYIQETIDVLVDGNHVHDMYQPGVHTDCLQLYRDTLITITNNRLHDSYHGQIVMHEGSLNILYRNNLFAGAWGAYTIMVSSSDSCRWIGNTFGRSLYSPISFRHGSDYCSMYNNILQGLSLEGSACTTFTGDYNDIIEGQVTYDDRLIGGSWQKLGLDTYRSKTGNGIHSFSADPLFADTAARDYSLLPGSPCIDAGTSDYGNETDQNGNARWDDPNTENTGGGTYGYYDIGAYEYTSTVVYYPISSVRSFPTVPNPWKPSPGWEITGVTGTVLHWRDVRSGLYLVRRPGSTVWYRVVVAD